MCCYFITLPAMASVFLFLSVLPAILLMPVLLKYGVEKGRILYYILFGALFAVVAVFGISDSFHPAADLSPAVLTVAAAVLWVVSLTISQAVYPKRVR